MQTEVKPELGKWYKDIDKNYFEVVAIDHDDDTIEVQYFDGTVSELDMDSWDALEITPRAAPEDWSGPYDDLERDDFADNYDIVHPSNLDEELDNME